MVDYNGINDDDDGGRFVDKIKQLAYECHCLVNNKEIGRGERILVRVSASNIKRVNIVKYPKGGNICDREGRILF